MSEPRFFALTGSGGSSPALLDAAGLHSYAALDEAAGRVARALLAGRADLAEERVGLWIPPSFDFVAALWGVWRAGGIAVPLALSHPAAELAHALPDTGARRVIVHPEGRARVEEAVTGAPVELLTPEAVLSGPGSGPLPEITPDRAAFILFTSGTTSRPKGVVWTHAGFAGQVSMLIEAWGWTAADRTLLVLPLHHVHGLVNVVSCALGAGACCELHPRFEAEPTWERLASGEISVFMAVPTVYSRLIASWEAASPAQQRRRSEAARGLRLMVSGSAALPASVLERWREITGHTLLERYGMTEIGMALSNPLAGERIAGAVGRPLPGVETRLVDEEGKLVPDGEPGELEVRGPALFREYWRRPEATAEAFREGWFRTGDMATVDEHGVFRILGRKSSDILKTGGFKVSALEIEAALLEHPAIAECAVVGVEDADWGERVSAACVPRAGRTLELEPLREWARERLAPYKLPSRLLIVDALPRNAMGKVVKAEVVKLFTAGS